MEVDESKWCSSCLRRLFVTVEVQFSITLASKTHSTKKYNMIPRSARLRLLSSSLPVLVRQRLHTTVRPPLKLAIIGAGPSGFYTASRILSLIPPSSPEGQNLEIHMYERLPTPYGLVRYGVAPDHPEVKVCFLCFKGN